LIVRLAGGARRTKVAIEFHWIGAEKECRRVDPRAPVRRIRGGRIFLEDGAMVGFITERELEPAEAAFPGIVRFLESLSEKPRTFLELVALFEHSRASAQVHRLAA